MISARNESELRRVQLAVGSQQLTGNNLEQAVLVQCLDLADHASFPQIVKEVLAKTGGVDVLVNNAGLSQRSFAKDTSYEVDRRLIEVNLFGTIALSKALLPHFLEKKSGHFVVVTSLMGKFGAPLRSTYAAAKHGLHGFFDSLRAEVWRENVKVILVCPGYIRTNISINALTADGSAQGTMDDATGKGMLPEVLAKKILRAVVNGKEEIAVGGRELMGIYLKRFFPKLLSKIVRKAKVT